MAGMKQTVNQGLCGVLAFDFSDEGVVVFEGDGRGGDWKRKGEKGKLPSCDAVR